MNLLERLEVIAADYYTKAMAIRTTIHILQEMNGVEEAPKKKAITKRKYKMSSKVRKEISKRMKVMWAKKRADKDNKSRGKEKS